MYASSVQKKERNPAKDRKNTCVIIIADLKKTINKFLRHYSRVSCYLCQYIQRSIY